MSMLERLGDDDHQTMGPYRLFARLGSGSFGTVYAAKLESGDGQSERQGGTQKLAAVKVAKSDSADHRAHFAAEIQAIKLVESARVPRFIDAHVETGLPWIATELIPGLSLDSVVRECGPLGEDAVWHLGAGLAEALTDIHAVSLVHHDLRPKNVLLVPAGPWVIDFSLASRVDVPDRRSSMKARDDYRFMPPEEIAEVPLVEEPAVDVFGFAATLVYAAMGRPAAESHKDAMEGKYDLDGLPNGIRDLLSDCLQKVPRLRISTRALKRLLARRVGTAEADGFAALLPPDAQRLLVSYQLELAERLDAYGPAQLGWRDPSRSRPTAAGGTGTVHPPHQGTQLQRPDATAGDTPVHLQDPVSIRWKSPSFGRWISGSVAVRDGRVVVAFLDGSVAILNAGDGEAPSAWRKPLDVGAPLHSGPLLHGEGPDARAYLGAADGTLHAIDLASRRHRILLDAAAPIQGTPVMNGERVCALSADGRVHSIHPVTGERDELYRVGTAARGILSAARDYIFATDDDGWVHAIDVNTGQPKWPPFHTDGLVLAKPLPIGNWVYVCGTDGLLRKIGIRDGEQRTTSDVDAAIHVAPVHKGNRLYVASSDGVVHAYDISGGAGLERVWSHPLREEIAGLAVSGGRIYVATGPKLVELQEVDESSRLERTVLSLVSLIGSAPVISGGRCYVGGLDGTVACLPLN